MKRLVFNFKAKTKYVNNGEIYNWNFKKKTQFETSIRVLKIKKKSNFNTMLQNSTN